MGISFIPLTRDHFGLLATWLAEPLVARWWNHETSAAALEKDFGAAIDQAEPTEIFLAAMDGQPFGLIQRYAIDAYPDYERELSSVYPVPTAAISMDYLIGDPARRGIGLGAHMITEFVRSSDASCALVPVSAANRASWRALERAGFTRVAEGELEPDNPIDSRDHYIYRYDIRPFRRVVT